MQITSVILEKKRKYLSFIFFLNVKESINKKRIAPKRPKIGPAYKMRIIEVSHPSIG